VTTLPTPANAPHASPAPPSKVCIVGAGAIGGWLGTRLAVTAAAHVSAVARGATLAALQTQGWRMHSGGQLLQAPAIASDEPAALGVQDVVVIAVKGPALAELGPRLAPLVGPDTLIVPAMNGVPWWFCHSQPGQDHLQQVLDPGARLAAHLPLAQVLGCAVHVSAAMPEPGLVAHHIGNRLVIGEPTGGRSPRVQALAALLQRAGVDAVVAEQVRRDIWQKLLTNLTMNPLSAIAGTTVDRLLADPVMRQLCLNVMREAQEIAQQLGCQPEVDTERTLNQIAKAGAIKTSMLQDLEAGRPLELDAIVGTVYALGRALGLPCPSLTAVYGLAGLAGQLRGLYARPELAQG
jgi:2-dehydropantoate 2-reductase